MLLAIDAGNTNIVFAVCGISLLALLERPGDRDVLGAIRARFQLLFQNLDRKLESAPSAQKRRWALLPQLVDTYVLTQFLFYFLLWLANNRCPSILFRSRASEIHQSVRPYIFNAMVRTSLTKVSSRGERYFTWAPRRARPCRKSSCSR